MSEKLEKARLYEIEEAKISRRKRNRPFMYLHRLAGSMIPMDFLF